MQIKLLNKNDSIYSSNAYLVLGAWNTLADVNTMIDVGNDPSILAELEKVYTGVGKKRVDQVILTHNHFDHTGNLAVIKKRYQPKVYAFGAEDYVDQRLKDGQKIRLGDKDFEVIHTPGHSSDSICLYNEKDGILFSGDTPLRILTSENGYAPEFIGVLERLAKKKIRALYAGHDQPMKEGVQEMIKASLKNVKAGR